MNKLSGDWNARQYDELPLPHVQWADGVLERAMITQHDTVVDIGCGTGRDLERIVSVRAGAMKIEEHGSLFGIDTSPAMLEQARARFLALPSDDRPTVWQADVTQPWPTPVPADVIVSIAALHWVDDHAAAFREAAMASKPGARFHAECGGVGNIATVLDLIDDAAPHVTLPRWNFATPDDTAHLLEQAGFEPVRVWLQPWPVELGTRERCISFLQTVVLRDAPESAIATVADALPHFTVDYVRIAWEAVRR